MHAEKGILDLTQRWAEAIAGKGEYIEDENIYFLDIHLSFDIQQPIMILKIQAVTHFIDYLLNDLVGCKK